MKHRNDAIYGALGGDIIGSIYEFRGARSEEIELFKQGCRFTDDSVLTIAIADWYLHRYNSPQEYLLKYAKKFNNIGYGPSFVRWVQSDEPLPYLSCGNGSAMRVSAIGCAAGSVEEALDLAEKSATPTHNHPEGIKGAQAIAVAIFLARKNWDKRDIRDYLSSLFGYNLRRSYNDLFNKEYTFNVLCQNTVPEALICFFESESYEECVRKAMLTNMDTDTAAAIAGSVAAAYYGLSDQMRDKIAQYLPDEFIEVASDFEGEGPIKMKLMAGDDSDMEYYLKQEEPKESLKELIMCHKTACDAYIRFKRNLEEKQKPYRRTKTNDKGETVSYIDYDAWERENSTEFMKYGFAEFNGFNGLDMQMEQIDVKISHMNSKLIEQSIENNWFMKQ